MSEPQIYVAGDTPPMMQCGHAAQGTMKTPGGEIWACIIDAGITAKSLMVADTAPDLDDRFAVCSYRTMRNGQAHPLNKIVPSTPALAFFKSRPDEETDEYYCGCWGWD